MRLTPEAVDWLIGMGGAFGALVAAGAATWKFFVWLKDRDVQVQLDSAAYFMGRDAGGWRADFGRKHLERLHFKRLTGVDVGEGHESIVNLHRKLGANDLDWETLAKVRRFLVTEGRVARVRKLHRRDAVNAVALYSAALLSFVVAGALMSVALNWSLATHWTAMSLQELGAVAIAALYSGSAACLSWVFWVVGGRIISAWSLRRRLMAPRVKRMRLRRTESEASLSRRFNEVSGQRQS